MLKVSGKHIATNTYDDDFFFSNSISRSLFFKNNYCYVSILFFIQGIPLPDCDDVIEQQLLQDNNREVTEEEITQLMMKGLAPTLAALEKNVAMCGISPLAMKIGHDVCCYTFLFFYIKNKPNAFKLQHKLCQCSGIQSSSKL